MRDTNRARVYTAEQAVRSSLRQGAVAGSPDGDITFATVDDAQLFLDNVRKHWETADMIQALPIHVFEKAPSKAKQKFSTYYAVRAPHGMPVPAIGLYPGWGFTGLVLCHEYAHHLVRLVGDENNVMRAAPPHGSEFARTFLDVVKHVYADNPIRSGHNPEVPATLETAFDKRRVLVDPFSQRDAARKQVLRLRSDVVLTSGDSVRTIPISMVIYANDPDDYSGRTYDFETRRLQLASTHGELLKFGDQEVPWRSLRYFEAPMVRVR